MHKTIKRYRCFLRFIPEKLLMNRKRNANASLCSTLPLLKQYFSEKSCTNVVYENTKNNKTCLVLKKQRCVCSAAKEISNHASVSNQIKIKSSLYSPYYAEARNEFRGPSPRLSARATQLRRNVATVASRWRHCADLTGPGIEPQTSRTDSVRLATDLTAGSRFCFLGKNGQK